MFDQEKEKRANAIINKIANNISISFEERIFIERIANNNSAIYAQIKKAQANRRLDKNKSNELTNLLGSLGLDGTFRNEYYDPSHQNICEWFSSAPEWLRRS